MSTELREWLKEAAAATRPLGSTKLGSASRVVRELLRNACGMPSRDGGVTLQRLADWLESGQASSEPSPSRTGAELEEDLETLAFQLLIDRDRERFRRLAKEVEFDAESGRMVQRLHTYSRRKVREWLPVYEAKVRQHQRHLPPPAAERKALAFVATIDASARPCRSRSPGTA